MRLERRSMCFHRVSSVTLEGLSDCLNSWAPIVDVDLTFSYVRTASSVVLVDAVRSPNGWFVGNWKPPTNASEDLSA